MKKMITEAAYPGNIGFEEMVSFYKVASKREIALLEKAIKSDNWEQFKDIIQVVLKIKLV